MPNNDLRSTLNLMSARHQDTVDAEQDDEQLSDDSLLSDQAMPSPLALPERSYAAAETGSLPSEIEKQREERRRQADMMKTSQQLTRLPPLSADSVNGMEQPTIANQPGPTPETAPTPAEALSTEEIEQQILLETARAQAANLQAQQADLDAHVAQASAEKAAAQAIKTRLRWQIAIAIMSALLPYLPLIIVILVILAAITALQSQLGLNF